MHMRGRVRARTCMCPCASACVCLLAHTPARVHVCACVLVRHSGGTVRRNEPITLTPSDSIAWLMPEIVPNEFVCKWSMR